MRLFPLPRGRRSARAFPLAPLPAAARRAACAAAFTLLAGAAATPLLAQDVVMAPAATLGELVEWHGVVWLEAGGAPLGDSIDVRPDPAGGFLVADARAAQVRRYLPDGRLAWTFGEWGRGTGQFTSPVALLRLRSGRFLACERTGRLTTLAEDGQRVISTVATGVAPLEDASVVDDTLVLLTERARPPLRPLLHVWNLRTAREVAAGFDAASAFANPIAARVVGLSRASLRGDTILATFAPSDSLYLLGRDGSRITALALPSSRFRRIGQRSPRLDPRGASSSFDLVTAAYPLSEGRVLVLYESVAREPQARPTRHLLLMDAEGRGLAEVSDVPRLLAVKGDTLYFQADEDPAHLAVASVRR